MKDRLIKLRFTIDRLTLRERITVLVTSILAIFALWYVLVYSMQMNTIEQTRISREANVKSTDFFTQKTKTIENLATDKKALNLFQEYQELKKTEAELDKNTERYEQKYISSEELSKLLFAILKKSAGVTLVDVIDTESRQQELPTTDATSAAANTATPTTPPVPNGSPATPQTTTPPESDKPIVPVINRSLYTVTLKGDYFSIVHYLSTLEETKWQLYWDKFTYKVIKYPDALVTLQFYTVRPIGSISTISEGGQ